MTTICRTYNKIILERRREKEKKNEGERKTERGKREDGQPPSATMRHFIINPPVAPPPPRARPQSEIQIKHANICVFYSWGFVRVGPAFCYLLGAARAEFNSFCYKYISGRGKLPHERGKRERTITAVYEEKRDREKKYTARGKASLSLRRDRFFRKIE